MTGRIPLSELFRALEPIERSLTETGRDWQAGWERPFSSTKYSAMLEADADSTVLVPGEDKERGKAAFAWRLPFKLRDRVERMEAIKVRAV